MTAESLKRWQRRLTPRRIQLRREWREREKLRQDGPPPGLETTTLDEVCRDRFGGQPKRVFHAPISGWKISSAFRVWVHLPRGKRRTLVFKDANYDPSLFPAGRLLPARIGIPEYAFYRQARGEILRYLPELYLLEEVSPGQRYRYLMEDLLHEYRHLKGRDVAAATSDLLEVHSILEHWTCDSDLDSWIRYDRTFYEGLLDYVEDALHEFQPHMLGEETAKILAEWPTISKVCLSDEMIQRQTLGPIHGDTGSANMFVHRKPPFRLKLVDWEWAGFGVPQADLVHVLKRNPEFEPEAMRILAERDGRLSLREHTELYHWTQLWKGLLDVGLFARQFTAVGKATLSESTEKSAHMVMHGYSCCAI